MFIARLLHEGAVERAALATSIDVRHAVAQHEQHRLAGGGGDLQFPARPILRHGHAEVSGLARRQIDHRGGAAHVIQIHQRNGVAAADAAADQRVAHRARPDAVDNPDVINPRLQRLTHAHRQDAPILVDQVIR